MKNFFKLISFLSISTLTLLSCQPKYEMHQTNFYPMNSDGKTFFADQELDSIILVSFDPWTINTTESWITVTPQNSTDLPDKGAGLSKKPQTKLLFHFTPNNTGKVRNSIVKVKSYFDISMPIQQLYFLNIQYPYISINDNKFVCETTVEDKTKTLHIIFDNYKDGATISSDANWVSTPDSSFKSGHHILDIPCQENTTTSERIAKFTLTSNGISNIITFKQKAKEQD